MPIIIDDEVQLGDVRSRPEKRCKFEIVSLTYQIKSTCPRSFLPEQANQASTPCNPGPSQTIIQPSSNLKARVSNSSLRSRLPKSMRTLISRVPIFPKLTLTQTLKGQTSTPNSQISSWTVSRQKSE